jgi:hypothetical protein
MVRVGGSKDVPPEVIAAYNTPTEEVPPNLSGKKDKKKSKKGKNKKPTPQQEQDYAEIHADEPPVDEAQGAQEPEEEYSNPALHVDRAPGPVGSVFGADPRGHQLTRLMAVEDARYTFEGDQVVLRTGDKVGLPPRVRFVQNCVRKVKENGRDENTVIVGVDDMEILFEFFGYPL